MTATQRPTGRVAAAQQRHDRQHARYAARRADATGPSARLTVAADRVRAAAHATAAVAPDAADRITADLVRLLEEATALFHRE